MKDNFQWTPELLAEFFNTHPDLPPTLMNEINLFKSSKAPKKEWEIVAFKLEDKIYKLTNDGQYRDVRPAYSDGVAYFGLDYAFEPKNNCTIHSVRRLSDGTIWLINETLRNKCVITAFVISGNEMLIKTDKGTFQLHQIEKLPAPVLTTVDGVEVFKGEDYWGAEVGIGPCRYEAGNENFSPCANMKLFSTKESALQYQRDNRPLLSLNDVKEAAGVSYDDHVYTSVLFEKLTALVKQKLNP